MATRVLIVEDDDTLRETLRDFLDMEGFEPTTARDGIEGLAALDHGIPRPDVILLDLMMPRMDGIAFAEELRRRGQHDDIPIVLLTADARGRTRAEQIGAVALVAKPFDLLDLLRLLERVSQN